MSCFDALRERIERASDLPGILDASYYAFATMLDLIYRQQDRGGPLLAAFVMAGVPASSGRLALLAAPSLPASTRLTSPTPTGALVASPEQIADAVSWLSLILAHRLDDEAATADNAEDRNACVEAARHAWALHARLG
jgi:hypothetical protein